MSKVAPRPIAATVRSTAPTRAAAPASAEQIHSDLEVLGEAVEMYTLRNGTPPCDLPILVERDGQPRLRRRPSSLPLDPWGRSYLMDPTTEGSTRLYTLGADGSRGGSGKDLDHSRLVGSGRCSCTQ